MGREENLSSASEVESLNPDSHWLNGQVNNGVSVDSVRRCVHDLIHDRCLMQPNAPAVCAWDGTLTYGELDSRSTKLARLLARDYEIRKEMFISIYLEKSFWTPVAIMGVMKAGAAFVLLDPAHPPDRLRQIIHDTACPLLLTSTACSRLATELGIESIILEDMLIPATDDESSNGATATVANVTPENIMYAVFTSGSTGKPKGVTFLHAAYSSSAALLQSPLQLGPQSRVMQFSSYAFDVSISDHLLTLIAGGCICIPSETDRQSDLTGSMSRFNVNWACITPSVARTLSPYMVPSLQHLVLTGETVTRTDVDTWAAHVNLIGLYGPAEYAIGTTVNVSLGQSASATNIGRAYSANCWVVDPQDYNEPLPPGAEGEMLIQGPGLGSGYINNPGQTANSFITAPARLLLSGQTGLPASKKAYKTGDLVRYNEDDRSFAFLGRRDTQVKLHGQRIELGEIEYHVQRCFPGVRDVVAEVVQPRGSTQRLAVFVCLFDNQGMTTGTAWEELISPSDEWFQSQVLRLESALALRLPKYMVPDFIVRVASIPMTTTGKVERRRLREHVASLSLEELNKYCYGNPAADEAPITANEKTLQRLWGQILNINPGKIGQQSNWFHQGGDSLLAMKLAGHSRTAGLLVSVQDVFQHPKLSELAKVARPVAIEDRTESVAAFELLPNDPVVRERIMRCIMDQYFDINPKNEIEDIYPCTAAQSALIMSSAFMGSNHTMTIECQLPPGIDEGQLVRAWKTVVQANPILRTHMVQVGAAEYFQVVFNEDVSMDIVSHWPVEGQTMPSNKDIWGFKQPLIRLMKHHEYLKMQIHHTVYDGYSIPVIFQHLAKAYSGEALIPQPFGPFLRWLQRSEANYVDEFWGRKLADFQGKTFPSDEQISMPMARSVLERPFELNLLKEKTASEFTVESKLRLALAIILSRATSARDVSFGTVRSRRGAPVCGITEMTAPTPAVSPARVQLKPENTLWTSLKHVQEQALEAIPFEGAELQHIGELSADTAAACHFQTCLVVQPDPSDAVPEMFLQWRQSFERDVFPWGLCFECVLSRGSIQIQVSFDERMVDMSRVQLLREQLAEVFQLIERAPNTCIGALIEHGEKWQSQC